MKIIGTKEFRKDLKKYLELSKSTELIIHNSRTGESFRVEPVED